MLNHMSGAAEAPPNHLILSQGVNNVTLNNRFAFGNTFDWIEKG